MPKTESFCVLAPIPRSFNADYVAIQQAMVKALGDKFSPEPLDDQHITLCYVGDSPSEARDTIADAAGRVAAKHDPIVLQPRGLGTFPPGPNSKGKIPVYIDYVDNTELSKLHHRLRERLQPYVDTEKTTQFSAYRPHSTLGYFEGTKEEADAAVAPFLNHVPRPWTLGLLQVTDGTFKPYAHFSMRGEGTPTSRAIRSASVKVPFLKTLREAAASVDSIMLHYRLYEGYKRKCTELEDKVQRFADGEAYTPEQWLQIKREIAHNLNALKLHEMYLSDTSLAMNNPVRMNLTAFGEIARLYDPDHPERLAEDIRLTAMAIRPGWVVVCLDTEHNRIVVDFCEMHDIGHIIGAQPVAVLDMWEHAYQGKYGVDKAKYITDWFQQYDWAAALRRMQGILASRGIVAYTLRYDRQMQQEGETDDEQTNDWPNKRILDTVQKTHKNLPHVDVDVEPQGFSEARIKGPGAPTGTNPDTNVQDVEPQSFDDSIEPIDDKLRPKKDRKFPRSPAGKIGPYGGKGKMELGPKGNSRAGSTKWSKGKMVQLTASAMLVEALQSRPDPTRDLKNRGWHAKPGWQDNRGTKQQSNDSGADEVLSEEERQSTLRHTQPFDEQDPEQDQVLSGDYAHPYPDVEHEIPPVKVPRPVRPGLRIKEAVLSAALSPLDDTRMAASRVKKSLAKRLMETKPRGASGKRRLIKDIETLLLEAKEAYYNTGKPIFDDATYDDLEDRLRELHPKSKVLRMVGAPTPKAKGKVKVKHEHFMGSLSKVKPDNGTLERWVSRYTGPYVVSDKLDGISLVIYYRPGKAPLVLTRGKGTHGIDVSSIYPHLRNVPKASKVRRPMVVRGEAIMSEGKFQSKYAKGAANARNHVGGLLNQNDPDKKAVRDIDFIAYRLLSSKQKISTQFRKLKAMGYRIPHWTEWDELDADELVEYLSKRKGKSRYAIDGLVIENDKRNPLPKSGNPAWAVAFKARTADAIKKVRVTDVIWTASRHGYLKPRVEIEPTKLAGVTVTYATGHNFKYIKDNRIGPGATINIVRSGDVIPYIVDVVKPARRAKLPKKGTYELTKTGVDAVLVDQSSHGGVAAKNITYFFRTLGVEGFSSGTTKRMIEGGLTTIEDILNADIDDIEECPGIGPKSAQKLWENIREATDKAHLPTVMRASGIFGRNIGSTKLNQVYDEYPAMLSGRPVKQSTVVRRCAELPGWSEVSAQKFAEALPRFIRWLRKMPITVAKRKPKPTTGGLAGQVIVFTGFRDKDLVADIEKNAGKFASGLTRKTTLLVYDPNGKAGSKLDKAQAMGIKTMTREKFTRKVGRM